MPDIVSLTLRAPVSELIEVEALTPSRVADLSEAEIAALPVWAGSRQAAVGDFFTVKGERVSRMQVEGDLRNVDGLGAGCAGG